MFSVNDYDFLRNVLKKVKLTKKDLSRIPGITSSVEEMILKFYFGRSSTKKFLSMKIILSHLLSKVDCKSTREKILFQLGELNGYLKCSNQIAFNEDYIPNSDTFLTFRDNIKHSKNILLLFTPGKSLSFFEIMKMVSGDDLNHLHERLDFLEKSGLITQGLSDIFLTDLGIIMQMILLES